MFMTYYWSFNIQLGRSPEFLRVLSSIHMGGVAPPHDASLKIMSSPDGLVSRRINDPSSHDRYRYLHRVEFVYGFTAECDALTR